MNRRLCGPSPLIVCCGALVLLICSPFTLAQPSGATGTVPPDVKTKFTPAQHRESLQQFIAAQVAKMTSDDPAAQAQGRDALVREVETVGTIVPGPAYLDAYSELLNIALKPALAPDAPMRTRLNAAIVVARVAERAPDTIRLLEAVQTALSDKADPVVLWGLKAARWILPAVMNNQIVAKDQRLLTAIVPAAKAHAQGPLSGAIVREAYDAVSLDVTDAARGKRVTDAMIKAAINQMHGLMALRVEQYRKSMPAEPMAETRATSFLANPRVWPLHDGEQQLRSVQLMSDLLWLAAQHAASGNTSPERDQLPVMVQLTARALAVHQPPNVAALLKPAGDVAPTTPGLEIKNRVQPVFDALKQNEKLKALTPPPMLGADAAAAAAPNTPASGPTTLPGVGGGPTTAPTAAPAPDGTGAPQPGAAPTKPPGPGGAAPPRGTPAPPPTAPPPGGAAGRGPALAPAPQQPAGAPGRGPAPAPQQPPAQQPPAR